MRCKVAKSAAVQTPAGFIGAKGVRAGHGGGHVALAAVDGEKQGSPAANGGDEFALRGVPTDGVAERATQLFWKCTEELFKIRFKAITR